MSASDTIGRIERYFNVREVVFDLAVAFLAAWLLDYIRADSGRLRDAMGYGTAQALVLVEEFFIAFFLGRMARGFCDKELSGRFTSGIRPIAVIYVLFSLYMLFMLFVSLPPLFNAEGFLTYVFGIMVLVLGAFTGLAAWAMEDDPFFREGRAARKSRGVGDDTRRSPVKRFIDYLGNTADGISYAKHPVLIALPLVAFLFTIVFVVMMFHRAKGFTGLLVFAGAIVAGIAVLYVTGIMCLLVMTGYRHVREKLPGAYFLITNVAHPAVTAFLLLVWNSIYMDAAFRESGTRGVAYVLFILTVTGIIPVRVFMALEPPVRPVNLFLGLVALAYFVYSVVRGGST